MNEFTYRDTCDGESGGDGESAMAIEGGSGGQVFRWVKVKRWVSERVVDLRVSIEGD